MCSLEVLSHSSDSRAGQSQGAPQTSARGGSEKAEPAWSESCCKQQTGLDDVQGNFFCEI